MRNIFYCPKCKKLEVNFKFDDRKQRNEMTWSNSRDGYGRIISHIICPNCNYELSGFMNMLGMVKENGKDEEIKNLICYVKDIISMYSNSNFHDVENLLKLIRKNRL